MRPLIIALVFLSSTVVSIMSLPVQKVYSAFDECQGFFSGGGSGGGGGGTVPNGQLLYKGDTLTFSGQNLTYNP